jgi:hypothetical protein
LQGGVEGPEAGGGGGGELVEAGLLGKGGLLLTAELGEGVLLVGEIAGEAVELAGEAGLLVAGLIAGGERSLAFGLVGGGASGGGGALGGEAGLLGEGRLNGLLTSGGLGLERGFPRGLSRGEAGGLPGGLGGGVTPVAGEDDGEREEGGKDVEFFHGENSGSGGPGGAGLGHGATEAGELVRRSVGVDGGIGEPMRGVGEIARVAGEPGEEK